MKTGDFNLTQGHLILGRNKQILGVVGGCQSILNPKGETRRYFWVRMPDFNDLGLGAGSEICFAGDLICYSVQRSSFG